MKRAFKPQIDISTQNAKTVFDHILNTVLPPRCVISGEIVDRQGMIAAAAWSQLDFIVNPMCDTCGFPFDFEVEKGSLCASCIDYTPPFTKTRSALKYDDVSRDLILGFKHADQTHMVRAFIPWLEKAGAEFLPHADLLIPVPLHRWRLLSRRYNQAAIIAQALSKAIQIPVAVDGLRRTRPTPSQGHLKAGERRKNVKRAFAVNPKIDIKDKAIVLIDDVYTTGSTVKECTKVLKKAGAKEVNVLTLTRVTREGFGG